MQANKIKEVDHERSLNKRLFEKLKQQIDDIKKDIRDDIGAIND